MKKTLFVLLALLGLAAPHAHAALTYEAVVRVTLPVVNVSSAIFAFQNTATSGNQDIIVRRIDIASASTMTVAGGLGGYWVYTSTSLTHSTAVSTWTYSLNSALASKPSYVTFSTAPYNILAEGDVNLLGADSNVVGVPPILRPLFVNNDETATSQQYDSWTEAETLGTGNNDPTPIVLPAGSQRAIVIRYKPAAAAIGAGSLFIRIIYSIR